MARRRNDAGQALVTVAFGLVVILGFLGLALDVGYLRVMKRHVQRAADAAALAGAAEVSHCSGTSNCSALQKAAQSAVTENGMGSSALATQCGTATGSLIVTVNNPPCYLSTNDPNHGSSSYVEVVVSETEPLMFAKIFGINTATVTARGEATSGGSTNCMYLLDRTDSETLYVTGGSRMQLPSCSMYIDSSSPTAVTVSGGSSITASSISIVGSDSVTGGSSITPANPATGASVVADPLASLPKPSYTPCTVKGSTYVPTNGTVILAGSYCGGITVNGGNTVSFGGGNYVIAGGLQIGNGATVTFGSGMYVIEGGGMSLNGGTTNSGSGLTFFLTGTSPFPTSPLLFRMAPTPPSALRPVELIRESCSSRTRPPTASARPAQVVSLVAAPPIFRAPCTSRRRPWSTRAVHLPNTPSSTPIPSASAADRRPSSTATTLLCRADHPSKAPAAY